MIYVFNFTTSGAGATLADPTHEGAAQQRTDLVGALPVVFRPKKKGVAQQVEQVEEALAKLTSTPGRTCANCLEGRQPHSVTQVVGRRRPVSLCLSA